MDDIKILEVISRAAMEAMFEPEYIRAQYVEEMNKLIQNLGRYYYNQP